MSEKTVYHCKAGETDEGFKEFGEVYHVVVSKQIDRQLEPTFKNFDDGKDFYDLFNFEQAEKGKASELKLPETANWISERFNSSIQQKLRSKLLTAAEQAGWEKDLPVNLKKFWDPKPKVLIWLRNQTKWHPERNISVMAAKQLANLCHEKKAQPVYIGNKKDFGTNLPSKGHLRGFYETNEIKWFENQSIAKQLWYLDSLYERGGVIASVGMMSGAMDGLPMICNQKVVFLAKKEDIEPRMRKVTGKVPAMEWVELVFDGNFEMLSESELLDIDRRIWG
jgi:hypothetical protein